MNCSSILIGLVVVIGVVIGLITLVNVIRQKRKKKVANVAPNGNTMYNAAMNEVNRRKMSQTQKSRPTTIRTTKSRGVDIDGDELLDDIEDVIVAGAMVADAMNDDNGETYVDTRNIHTPFQSEPDSYSNDSYSNDSYDDGGDCGGDD